jgi:hypothetical protein
MTGVWSFLSGYGRGRPNLPYTSGISRENSFREKYQTSQGQHRLFGIPLRRGEIPALPAAFFGSIHRLIGNF